MSSDFVEVWSVWQDASECVNLLYRNLLSGDEAARADKFLFERLRRRYEIAHGALRLLLGSLLNLRAPQIELLAGPRGKPALVDSQGIQFNVSHSGNLAVFGFARSVDLGIDVEQLRDIADIDQIASHYFCEEESAEVLSIAAMRQRSEAFLRCWTRKEAYIKATGDGLFCPLDRFRVSIAPELPARFVHIDNDEEAAHTWTLHHIDPAQGYLGAVAYRGAARRLILHPTFEPEQLLKAAANLEWSLK